MKLKVLTQPGCMPCKAVIRRLEQSTLTKGVHYELATAENDPEILELSRTLDYRTAPVSLLFNGPQLVAHWPGYDPGRIDELIEAVANPSAEQSDTIHGAWWPEEAS